MTKTVKKIQFFLLLCTVNFFLINQAQAQIVNGVYSGWSVYEYGKNVDKKCYIAANPKNTVTSYTSSRKPYFSITKYFKSGLEEVSVYGDYEYKISSPVYLLITNQQLQLFTNGKFAWAENSYKDKEIINLILKSDYIKVRSDSATGQTPLQRPGWH